MTERICHIESGKIANPQEIRKLFSELQDGIYLVRVATRKPRSPLQNEYYWGVVCDMVREGLYDTGYREVKTKADAHQIMKMLFLKKKKYNHKTGKVKEYIGSTANLSTVEFNTYIEEIIQWAVEYLNIQIPLPNEIL
ncbi:hypothetical protein SAMN05428988_0119 [Chitinophaga sp. YR573]|uniref:hypothetical protein n=1 Tax=Chitinophaga sp. YR573 TaxID=1881040 RepID=UPI0008C4632D|nr:hypothetical protein [Chitinophaga sp. YR573]SEV88556.1 hypothetical protein SAMN05428988_0119 [Chitinophaga sp. YR573]